MSVRLPSHIKPIRYEIILQPNLEDFTFKGEETIELSLEKDTKFVTLHSVDLKIESNKAKISYDKENETVTLAFPKALKKGTQEINLKFRGILGDNLKGFYRSRYEHKGKEKYLATTQFEATDARRAFPSFDEPSHKAIFDITLIIPKGHTAISNSIESEVLEHETGLKVVKFQSTPKMSTYLLAFITGEFEWIEDKTKRGTLVRIFTTPGKKEHGKFALEVTVKTLEFYEEFFGIPYPLPALDLIAIPDFSAQAMENWGAVTYRETAILVDPKNTSLINKQWVALVIAHELAHQWFGNLVTMEWWTDLWLNEGFASFIEYLAVDHLFPAWDIWTQFVYLDLGAALGLDSLENTHPIEVEIHHPKEISEIFDRVSYSKGASVIRMIAEYLGEKDFREGLKHYLKTHQYGNARTKDLWKALEKVSKKPVSKIMGVWTSKSGYPVIEVEEKNGELKLTQSRFFSSKISKENSKDATTWMVPISTETKKGIQKHLMDKKSINLKVASGDWLKLNAKQTALARVKYPRKMLEALEKALKQKELGTPDRLGIVSDSFALARSGDSTASYALELLASYKEETEYPVWMEVASRLRELDSLFFDEDFYPQLKKYSGEIFAGIGKKVGWEEKKGEKHSTTLLRSTALGMLGGFGDKETIQRARELFGKILKGEQINPNLRGVVYNLIAENGGEKEYKDLLNLYRTIPMMEEKNRIQRALGNFQKEALLQKTLDFSLTKEVRSQDAPFLIGAVFNNPRGKKLAWEFLKKNWGELKRRYSGDFMLPRLISFASSLTTKEEGKDVENFFKKNKTREAAKAIAQTLEAIYSNDEWKKRDREKIKTFLRV